MTGNYIMCHYLHIIGFEQWELAVFWQVCIHPSETLLMLGILHPEISGNFHTLPVRDTNIQEHVIYQNVVAMCSNHIPMISEIYPHHILFCPSKIKMTSTKWLKDCNQFPPFLWYLQAWHFENFGVNIMLGDVSQTITFTSKWVQKFWRCVKYHILIQYHVNMSLSENLGDSPSFGPPICERQRNFSIRWRLRKDPMVFPLSWKIFIDGFPIYFYIYIYIWIRWYIKLYIYTHNISRCYLYYFHIYIHMKLYEPWTSIYNSV
jgi:hypothetical protein